MTMKPNRIFEGLDKITTEIVGPGYLSPDAETANNENKPVDGVEAEVVTKIV